VSFHNKGNEKQYYAYDALNRTVKTTGSLNHSTEHAYDDDSSCYDVPGTNIGGFCTGEYW